MIKLFYFIVQDIVIVFNFVLNPFDYLIYVTDIGANLMSDSFFYLNNFLLYDIFHISLIDITNILYFQQSLFYIFILVNERVISL